MTHLRTRNLLAVLLAAAALGGCAMLPGAAPTTNQVVGGLKPGDAEVITIVPGTPSGASALRPAILDWGLADAKESNDWLVAGDRLSIAVYEVGYPLFGNLAPSGEGSASGASARNFPAIVIPESGSIDFPYAGRMRVVGLTAEEVGKQLQARLRAKSRYIEVMVTAEPGPGHSALVSGDIAKPGRVVLSGARERLLDAVALAGGPTARRGDTLVRLTRGTSVGELRLDEVSADSSSNVVLAPGDRIELVRNTRTLTVLGAAQKVTEIPFESAELTLSEALARAGGPLDERADARGVFIFRYELREREGGPKVQPVIYRLDLIDPASYFAAQQFAMRPRDVMLIANARSNQVGKFLQMVNALTAPVVTVDILTRP
jgi:polysaccharide export outer membrane protein